MIILAAAIILSLSNSGIIGKANKSKTDTDIASAKDIVAMAHADWMLDEAKIKENDNTITSFSNYAEKKLQEAGYKVGAGEGAYTVTEDGEIYSDLTETARSAIVAGIKIGDKVTGYTVTETTYTTSGEENTALNGSETDPQPQTVTTNTDITWKYLGVNTNGELEIMADLSTTAAATNTKVKLGGKGGFLKGPDMLNTVCEKLYSKDGTGTARSMNIDDVNSILGYTGERGAYISASGNYTPTKEAMKIGDIVSQKGEPALSNTVTLDGKDVNTYYSDYYDINKTSDVKEMKNPGNVDLIYNAKNTYWLASPCVVAYFIYSDAVFDVRYVSYPDVSAHGMFMSYGYSSNDAYAVRPVVTLNSNVTLTKDANAANTWNISK